MSKNMGEINLSVFAQLMSMKLMQRLMYMESPLWIGLGTGLAGGVNL